MIVQNTGCFLDVNYGEIEASPVETIRNIYTFLGWDFSADAEAAMQRFVAANPKDKHGVHRYSLAQYGLSRDRELARFADYCQRFDIAVQSDA